MDITISKEEAKALQSILPRIINAPTMLATRTVTPSYNEIMALIVLCNALYKHDN